MAVFIVTRVRSVFGWEVGGWLQGAGTGRGRGSRAWSGFGPCAGYVPLLYLDNLCHRGFIKANGVGWKALSAQAFTGMPSANSGGGGGGDVTKKEWTVDTPFPPSNIVASCPFGLCCYAT